MGLILGILWFLLPVKHILADQPLKIWITPPKGKTLRDLKNPGYDWRSDKSRILDDIQVNDDAQLHANQWAPDVAVNTSGISIVVWEDWRNEQKDIYAQLLSIEGNPLGPNFKINDDRGSADQKDAAVCAMIDDSFLIVWRDGRNNNYDIFGQRISADGQRIRTNFQVNKPNSANQMNPVVEPTSNGSFIIAWEDWRNGNIDIYARHISQNGQPTEHEFKVNNDFSSADQTTADIAFDSHGNGIIVWRDFRNSKNAAEGGDIFAQRLNADGQPLGQNYQVNDKDHGTIDQCDPQVAMSSRGEMIIVWRSNRNENLDIYGQVYDLNGRKIKSNIQINTDDSDKAQTNPMVSFSSTGEFVVIWSDLRGGNYDVFAQCFAVTGNPIGPNFRVNDDFGSPATQKEPAIASDNAGNFVLCWTDYRFREGDHKTDIFAQRSYFDTLLDMAAGKTSGTPRNLTTHQSN